MKNRILNGHQLCSEDSIGCIEYGNHFWEVLQIPMVEVTAGFGEKYNTLQFIYHGEEKAVSHEEFFAQLPARHLIGVISQLNECLILERKRSLGEELYEEGHWTCTNK